MKLIELKDTSCEGDEIYSRNQLDAITDIFCLVSGGVWGMDTEIFESRDDARKAIIDALMNVVYTDKL